MFETSERESSIESHLQTHTTQRELKIPSSEKANGHAVSYGLINC